MRVKVDCECGATFRLPPESAGRRFKCKSCGAVLRVPKLAGSKRKVSKKKPNSAADRRDQSVEDRDEPNSRRRLGPRSKSTKTKRRKNKSKRSLSKSERKESLKLIGNAFLSFAFAAIIVVAFTWVEQNLERIRLPVIFAFLYGVFGKWGIALIFVALGSISLIMGVSQIVVRGTFGVIGKPQYVYYIYLLEFVGILVVLSIVGYSFMKPAELSDWSIDNDSHFETEFDLAELHVRTPQGFMRGQPDFPPSQKSRHFRLISPEFSNSSFKFRLMYSDLITAEMTPEIITDGPRARKRSGRQAIYKFEGASVERGRIDGVAFHRILRHGTKSVLLYVGFVNGVQIDMELVTSERPGSPVFKLFDNIARSCRIQKP